MMKKNEMKDTALPESEFLTLVEQAFEHLDNQIDAWASLNDMDVDIHRSSNMLTLIFEDDTQIIINRQTAVQEIWLAAPSGGFHYRYNGAHWVDTRQGTPLEENLLNLCAVVKNKG
jgi:CyaY protein